MTLVKKTTMIKRMLFALVNVVLVTVFLILYFLSSQAVDAYVARTNLTLASVLLQVGFAALPALYLRLFLAWMRRGLYKGQKLQWEVDVSGVAATVLLVLVGLVGYFFRMSILTENVMVYYFVALWVAVFCCAQRVPRPVVKEEPAPQTEEFTEGPAPAASAEVPVQPEAALAAEEPCADGAAFEPAVSASESAGESTASSEESGPL